jgi:ribosomal-protein-alanine acetyltransferase
VAEAVEVQAAADADLSGVAALSERAFGGDLTARWSEESLREWLPEQGTLLAVARAGGALAGYLVSRLVADEVELLSIAVEPGLRRRGVAGALLCELHRHACAGGARVVFLEVKASNEAARALYLGHGYAEVGLRPRYYSDGEDAVLMALEL